MTGVSLFPFAEYWWLYGAFTLFILRTLALDLGIFHRRAHKISTREAMIWMRFGLFWRLSLLVFFTLTVGGSFPSNA